MTADAARRPERIRRHQWLAVASGSAVRTPRGATGLVLAGFVVAVAVASARSSPRIRRTALLTLPVREAVRAVPARRRLPRPRRAVPGPGRRLAAAADGGGRDRARGRRRGRRRDQRRLPAAGADGLIMRIVDVILAFPQLVFALLLLSILGPKLWLIVLAVGPDARARGRPGAAGGDAGHLRAGLRQGGRVAGDAPGRGDDQGDPAQPEHAADGRGRAAADLLDHHHGGPGLPRLRPAAARRPAGGP